MNRLAQANVPMEIYEPTFSEDAFMSIPVERDVAKFKSECDVIVCNRYCEELSDVSEKIYTRDLWRRD